MSVGWTPELALLPPSEPQEPAPRPRAPSCTSLPITQSPPAGSTPTKQPQSLRPCLQPSAYGWLWRMLRGQREHKTLWDAVTPNHQPPSLEQGPIWGLCLVPERSPAREQGAFCASVPSEGGKTVGAEGLRCPALPLDSPWLPKDKH